MSAFNEAVTDMILAVPQHKKKYFLGLAISLVAAYLVNKRRLKSQSAELPSYAPIGGKKGKISRRVGVDTRFLLQMRRLLPICVPGLATREFGLLVALAGILIARTWLDIWFSGFNGVVVRSIVTRDWKLFWRNAIVLFGFMMWPMSIVNNSLKLCINNLSLAFRRRLTHYAHEQYLKGITFYKVANLDNRIQNADQLLTQDIDKFSETLSHLYSDITKPLVDIGLFGYKLGQAIGLEAPLYMIGYFAASGFCLRAISPPFGRFIATEQKLEGEFRYSHSRIIAHSEEIAFYNGSDREKAVANTSFEKIVRHMQRTFRYRFGNGIIDSVLVKYCATQLAYFILSRPVFGTKNATKFADLAKVDATQIMEDYSRNSGYLINLSQAVGRLVLAGRDLTRFAGYTSRVAELFEVLDDINADRYQRTMVNHGGAGMTEGNQCRIVDQKLLEGQVIEENGVIEFENVPIATPNGDFLVDSMSFVVESGMNCLITGPNGCGKSSLFRILGGLWPLFGGTLVKPTSDNMFYVPQKPYLPLGTLRDQIIYPHSQQDALAVGNDDFVLEELLQRVHLGYLVERENGFDAVQDWADVLSGGEKQRIAMGRLFYHRPQFAILDECTSAVSIDVEGAMYRYARELGITLFTVSHRPSLFPYHEYMLRFDGQGGYDFLPMEHEANDAAHPFAFVKMSSKHEDALENAASYSDYSADSNSS